MKQTVMALAIPLSQQQIEAARRLHRSLGQWQAIDRALDALAERFPQFDEPSALLKATAINALYGTNVFAIWRMADHVRKVLAKTKLASASPELVERLAALPKATSQKRDRRHLSFASKFAHFFIDAGRFPILDSYAARMVEFHLGKRNLVSRPGYPYVAFVENLGLLRAGAGLQCSTRELDHYLWIAGEYRVWVGNREAQINMELRRLFEAPGPQDKADLRAMLPTVLGHALTEEP